jgi:signal transduction histidine kinase/ActR/RegA family two-component response regulator
MFLPLLLRYRLDFVAFALLALAAGSWCVWLVHRRRPQEPLSPLLGMVLIGLVVAGGLLAEWNGEQRRTRFISVFGAFGPTYAYELQRLGHARVTFSTAPDDPTYLALIEAEKAWMRVNPLIADIYTFRADASGQIRMVVDSETDYDHNGVIEGEREARTAIGEVYPEATDDFRAALRGETRFDTTLVPDRWGLWVSSLTPIRDDTGRVEAVVGLDYPAEAWLSGILASRLVALAGTAVLVGMILASVTIGVLMRAEIRQRKAAQEQLRRDKEAVDLLSRAKTEFIGVMTHDIRSPLTALVGYADLLRESPLTPVQRRYVRTMANAAERLVAMLNDILDLTKLEAGKLVVASEPYAPAQVINEAADAMTARAMEKGLSLLLESTVPAPLGVFGDAARLRQVLTNLLSNAVKFTDRGGITLRAHWEQQGGGLGTLYVDVADTGPGIPADRVERIFDPYPSSHAAGSARAVGGAGLAVSRQLVELMGGKLSARSEHGAGSVFSFHLPCSVARPEMAPATPADATSLRPEPPAEPPNILLLNPSLLSRDIVKAVLARYGYRVHVANTTDEALLRLASTPFAAVFLDVEDAALDTLAVARDLRTRVPESPSVPVIAVSARTPPNRQIYLAAGINEYLTKPIYMPAVLSTLEAFVHPTPGSRPPWRP